MSPEVTPLGAGTLRVPPLLSSRWTERQEVMSESELLIRTLYEITSDYRGTFDDQLQRLLSLGCRRFGLEFGVASAIEGETWRIRQHASPPRFGLAVGQRFALAETLCDLTVKAGGAIGFEDLAKSSLAQHPAVARDGLRSYIGLPVRLGERLWGTISFFGHAPRAADFTLSDVDSLQLMSSWVATEAQRRMAEDALREAKRLLEHASRTDPLTGLFNRRAMEAELEGRRARGQHMVALLIDADDFKSVNSDFGHAGGDLVLQAMADRAREVVRSQDLFGRIGGDEFMALVPECTLDEAADLAERIRRSIVRGPVSTPSGPCEPRVSVGVVPVVDEARTITDILKRASAVLMNAKAHGKNRVVVDQAV